MSKIQLWIDELLASSDPQMWQNSVVSLSFNHDDLDIICLQIIQVTLNPWQEDTSKDLPGQWQQGDVAIVLAIPSADLAVVKGRMIPLDQSLGIEEELPTPFEYIGEPSGSASPPALGYSADMRQTPEPAAYLFFGRYTSAVHLLLLWGWAMDWSGSTVWGLWSTGAGSGARLRRSS